MSEHYKYELDWDGAKTYCLDGVELDLFLESARRRGIDVTEWKIEIQERQLDETTD